MTFSIDSTTCSVVVVCSCGWRHLDNAKIGAWHAAAGHERATHPGQLQASHAYSQARRRLLT